MLDELASLFLLLCYASLLVRPLASFIDPHPQLLIDISVHPKILWCWSLSYIFLSSHIYLERPLVSFVDPSASFEQLWSVVGQESRIL